MEAIMKKASFIIGAIAIVAAALLFTGCNPVTGATTGATTSVTAEEQMANFKKYIEAGNYDSLKSCCYSKAQLYSQADASFWETEFPDKKLFDYSVYGSNYKATYNQVSYLFTLIEETTGVFKISKIERVTNFGTDSFYY
jgi:predicted small secreted protein